MVMISPTNSRSSAKFKCEEALDKHMRKHARETNTLLAAGESPCEDDMRVPDTSDKTPPSDYAQSPPENDQGSPEQSLNRFPPHVAIHVRDRVELIDPSERWKLFTDEEIEELDEMLMKSLGHGFPHPHSSTSRYQIRDSLRKRVDRERTNRRS